MKQQSKSFVDFTSPIAIAAGVAILFSIRFLYCLPFSGSTRGFNYETVTTLVSFLIFAHEPWSFPVGGIKGLAFPFDDANIGNVGALPLFALSFKALGAFSPYFLNQDYFILVEILSCFLTAYFAQRVLGPIGVSSKALRSLGALLTGTSFLLLTRSEWLQPFCVVAFPLFMAWIYAMLIALHRTVWSPREDASVVLLFPLAALVDNYALFGMLLGTSALLVVEFYEAILGGLRGSWNRVFRIFVFCLAGSALSLAALFVVGMYPLPAVPNTFTSYDFGMGGRFHVADLFAPLIPFAKLAGTYPDSSLAALLHFPVDTSQLGPGQYEGIAYVGTPVLLVLTAIAAARVHLLQQQMRAGNTTAMPTPGRLNIWSPWKKVGLASLAVFFFSMGYELVVLGQAFPSFSGMPAAWIADRFPAVYNFRATGRLATLLSLFLILESVRRLSLWNKLLLARAPGLNSEGLSPAGGVVIFLLTAIHLIEIAPYLKPLAAQPLHPINSSYSVANIEKLRQLGKSHEVVLISPAVQAAGVDWTSQAFAFVYYSGLRSNLYYLARTLPDHQAKITTDLNRVANGDWEPFLAEYGNNTLFAIPSIHAAKLRSRMKDRFEETVIGPISVWAKRGNAK